MTNTDTLFYLYLVISTHTLTWSVTASCIRVCRFDGNFNSHAHVERDHEQTSSDKATSRISTHTLTWSVTFVDSFDEIVIFDFNSHAHVERDDDSTLLDICQEISTHTLTWSVTSDTLAVSQRTSFQLTRSRGA